MPRQYQRPESEEPRRKKKKKKKGRPGDRHLAQRQWKAQRTMAGDDVHHRISSGVVGRYEAANEAAAGPSMAATAPSVGSAAFAAYYRRQLGPLLGDDREDRDAGWHDLVGCLAKGLPVCFRLNASSAPRAITATLRRRLARSGEAGHRGLTGDLQFPGTFIQAGGDAIAVVARPLSATLGERGATCTWQLGTDRANLKRCAALRPLHAVLTREMGLGYLNRQESVSMLPALLARVERHHSVLDMCAAPGSKTRQLAELMARGSGNGDSATPLGVLVANDPDPPRATLLAKQFARNGAPHVVVTCARGEDVATKLQMLSRFDRVLADVPCSGDGTLRKQPELWRKWREEKGALLQPLQLALARAAVLATKIGGVAVYSTCALNPIEDEAVVAALLASAMPRGSLELVNAAATVMPRLARRAGLTSWWERKGAGEGEGAWTKRTPDAALHLERCVRILPNDANTGGFFVAVLQKKGDVSFPALASGEDAAEASASASAALALGGEEAALSALRGVGFKATASTAGREETLRALRPVDGSSALDCAMRRALAQAPTPSSSAPQPTRSSAHEHWISASRVALGRTANDAVTTDGTVEWRSAHYKLRRSDFAAMHLPQGAAALVDAGGENGALVHALTARAGVLLRGAAKELLIVAAGVALGRIATGPATDGVATCTFALDANAAVYAATRTVAEAPISTEGAPDAGLSTTKVITLSVGDFLWLAATSMAAVEAQFVAPKADAAAKGDGAKQSLTDPKVARALANVPIDVDVSGTNAAAEAAVLKRGERPRAPRIAASALFDSAKLLCGAEVSGSLRKHADKRWVDASGRQRGGERRKKKGRWQSGGSGTSTNSGGGAEATRKTVSLALSAAGRAQIVGVLLADEPSLNVLFVTADDDDDDEGKGKNKIRRGSAGGSTAAGAARAPPPQKRMTKKAEKRAKKRAREAYLASKAAGAAAPSSTLATACAAPRAAAAASTAAAATVVAKARAETRARPTLLCRTRPHIAADGRDDPHLIVLTAPDRLRSFADAIGWFL